MKFNILLLLIALLFFGSCSQKKSKKEKVSNQNIISAHTSGIVSRNSKIQIIFSKDMADSSMLNTPLEKSSISIEPKVNGNTIWTSPRELSFIPSHELKPKQQYTVSLNLSKIKKLKSNGTYDFNFTVINRVAFWNELSTTNNDAYQNVKGAISFSDDENFNALKNEFTAKIGSQSLPVKFSRQGNKIFLFYINHVKRGYFDKVIDISFNGKKIGIENNLDTTITIPSLSRFTVSSFAVDSVSKKEITISFSNKLPYYSSSNIKKYIKIEGMNSYNCSVNGNKVTITFNEFVSGKQKITISGDLQDNRGNKIGSDFIREVTFNNEKPEVVFLGKGTIIPQSTQKIILPIKTMNLKYIRVEAFQVFENNIPQFLQVNEMNGTNELKRVGKVVWKKRVPLNYKAYNKNRWVTSGIDMSELIANNGKGIYSIKLSFTPQDIAIPCSNSDCCEETVSDDNWDDGSSDESYWDYADDYYSIDWDEYHNNRNNPCHKAFYMERFGRDVSVSREVFISNIGLIAKKNADSTLKIIATNITEATPLGNATIELYNYQLQKIASAQTDLNGIATIKSSTAHPFLVKAIYGNDEGFLKLGSNNELAISHFNVGGAQLKDGINGYIYGERGVWRPGDTIFVSFVLKDNENPLPNGHPITFILKNSNGQIVGNKTLSKDNKSIYAVPFATSSEAPTGNWQVEVHIGGISFTKKLKVETVKPNRLEIKVDFPHNTYLTQGDIVTNIRSNWLTGAKASYLHGDMAIQFYPTKTTFENYSNYIFDDKTRAFYSSYGYEDVTSFQLDYSGNYSGYIYLYEKKDAPGILTASIRTRVFEKSGNFSVNYTNIPFYPYSEYVGIKTPKGDKARNMLLTDTTHRVQIVTVDTNGSPTTSSRVEVSIQKIAWKWWWETGAEDLTNYTGSSYYELVKKDTITTHNGTGYWDFKIKYPSWGRYLIRAVDLNSGHSTSEVRYIDWPGWASRAAENNPSGATVLSLVTDKKEYKEGETVTVSVPSARIGRALISVETGSKILSMDWVEATKLGITYTFKATKEMTPNAYVNVTLLQPYGQVNNDLPIRLYGITPISVTSNRSKLIPIISCKDEVKPNSKLTVKVREKSGKPFTYTLAVVDKGLLGLTNFTTPNPWNEFFKKVALGVKSWDIYSYVLGAYNSKLEQLLSIGGGDGGSSANKKEDSNRFPPMVRFKGPFTLKSGKTNTHTIHIPNYLGAVKVMVTAASDSAYGSADKSVIVKQPLMVLATLPRTLRPNELVTLPTDIFVLHKNIKNVTVSVKTEGNLSVIGDSSQSIAFNQLGNKLAKFQLQSSTVGKGKVIVTANGGGKSSQYIININIKPATEAVTICKDTTVAANETVTISANKFGINGSNSAFVELSTTEKIDLSRRMQYLITYPHGCVEQTVSSVFPQLFVPLIAQLTSKEKSTIEKNIKEGINRLTTFETGSGGFSYWPGENEPNEWGTSYALHFLLLAQKEGYFVPKSLLNNLIQYQKTVANNWQITDDYSSKLNQTYRLYTLALANKAQISAMNRLRTAQLPAVAKFRLALSYSLIGKQDVAKELINSVNNTDIENYQEDGNTFGSTIRDKAMILEAMVNLGNNSQAFSLSNEIGKALSSDTVLSTQTTAYSLIAMAQFIKKFGETKPMNFTLNNGNTTVTQTVEMPFYKKEISTSSQSPYATITNKGIHPIFTKLVLKGTPKVGNEINISRGLQLNVTFQDDNDRYIDFDTITQGTDVIATVSIYNRSGRNLNNLSLSYFVPSGWEIINDRIGGNTSVPGADYQDIRDDRIYTYFDLQKGKTKTFKFRFNASYAGYFYHPAISVSDMYDDAIKAVKKMSWLTIN